MTLLALPSLAAEPSPAAIRVDKLVLEAVDTDREGSFRGAHVLYEEAIAALAAARPDERSALRARILRHRGITLERQGAYIDARRDFAESVALFDQAGDAVGAGLSRVHLAQRLHSAGDVEGAEHAITTAEAAFLEAGDESGTATARLIKGRLRMHEGNLPEALTELEAAEAYFKRIDFPARIADALSLKAYTLQQMEEWARARDAYDELLGAAFRVGRQQLVAYAYCNLGDVDNELGAPTLAEEHLDRSLEMLDRIRATVAGGPEERIPYLDTQVSAYHRKIALLVDRGEPEAALETAERFHARAFLEHLDADRRGSAASGAVRDGNAVGSAPNEPLEMNDEERAALRELLSLQRAMLENGLFPAEEARLRAAEETWARLDRERRRQAIREDAKPVEIVPTARLREAMPAGMALLTYWMHPDRTFLWVVRREGVTLIQIPVATGDLEKLVERFRGPIADRTRAADTSLKGAGRAHLETGAELYRLLIEPADDEIESANHLVIAPDAALWFLPFEALVTKMPENGDSERREDGDAVPFFSEYAAARYLVQDRAVTYAHSAAAWHRLRARRPASSGFLAVAPNLEGSRAAADKGWSLPPLPGAREEARRLAALFPGAKTLEGEEATEAVVKSRIAATRIVHFAAHGSSRDDRPDLSGILLWPSTDDGPAGDASTNGGGTAADVSSSGDGILQSWEVARLPWRAELVTLAVCNSALGQLSRGEGLVGLGRSILAAGARNVLVTLWRVDDRASGLLMDRFYREIAAGRPLPDALRTAKTGLLEEVQTGTVVVGDEKVSLAHPYFWAPFVIIGGEG